MFQAKYVAVVSQSILRSSKSSPRPMPKFFSSIPSVNIQPKVQAAMQQEPILQQNRPDSRTAIKSAVDITNVKLMMEAVAKQEQVANHTEKVTAAKMSADAQLYARQVKIEEGQLVEAAQQYSEAFQSMAKMNRGASLKSAQRLLLQWYEPLVAALNKEFDEIAAGLFKEDRNQYAPYLVQLPVEKLAVITLTTTLNCVLRSGNQGEQVVKIAQEISSMLEAESHLLKCRNNKEITPWQRRVAASNKPTSARTLAQFNIKLRKVAKEEEWSQAIKVKVGALLIQTLLGAAQHGDGIASFIYTNNFYQHNQGYAKRKGFVRMDPAKYVEFGSLSAKDVNLLMPRYMPMVVHPKPWDNKEYSGAYHLMKAPIMKAISAQQSNAVRRGRMDSVLESLNYLGQIGWRINPVVHKVLEACVANKITLADMPSPENVPMPEESSCFRSVKDILADMKRVSARFEAKKKPGPVPASVEVGVLGAVVEAEDEEVVGEEVVAAAAAKTPSEAAYAAQQKHAALLAELEAADPEEMRFDERLYKFKCSRIAKKNGELHSLRCDLEIKMSIADKFRDDVMFFPHNIDFRGRAYPIPPNLSHLGNDFCRGIMMFDKAKPLGPKGLDWLKIHLANLCGYNKVSMADRVAWADQHMEEIRDSVRQPLDGKRWWATVESPFQALAACAEIVAATDSGNPAEYMCRLPVHQDGSCNGLQHYAGLGRDAQGGSAVNLVPHEKPQDVYSNVLTKVLQRIAADKEIPEDSLQALEGKCARMLDGYVSRKVIKQTVMTSVYGVTHSGARAQVEARLQEVFELDSASTTPEREKEVSAAAQYLAKLTLDSLAEMFQSARSIMDWLGNCAKIVADQDQAVSWVTPLGLPVIQPYRKLQLHTVQTVMQSISLASQSDVLPISGRKQKTAFPPNFVHSMDATHMMMTCLKMKSLGLNFAAVHDSYWTHACDIPIMSETLREAFVELYSLPLLEDLRESMVIRFPNSTFPPVPQRGSLDINHVKDSRYFFH